MRLNQSVKYLCVVAIAFASCRASRNVAATNNEELPPTIAVAVSPVPAPMATTDINNNIQEAVVPTESNQEVTTTSSVSKVKKRIAAFTQLKEMARSGEIAMSKKDKKTLNRLEKHYKGDYQKFRSDAFELTDKAKIIGGVGLLGLLLAIITGSAFGWFLFIVAALAFLLRYLNIIAF